MELGELRWLHALWAVAAIGAMLLIAAARRRAAAKRLIDAELLPAVAARPSLGRLVAKSLLVAAALACVALALARPRWSAVPQDVRRLGRDVVFVVDVSRSMLADDLKPSRLERAKLAIQDVLESGVGDRVGLVAFAGTAVTKVPLTFDYGFMSMQLDALSPASVPRGGTLIGDAIREALRSFDTESPAHRDIILITDGEDHESFPVEAAGKAGEMGVRIIAVGLGDETIGRPITYTDDRGVRRTVTYQGEPVRSKLDADTLRRVAAASNGGVYFNVATGNINLDEVYTQLVRRAEQTELEGKQGVRLEEQFQIFLAAALALLAIEAMIGERPRR